VTFTAVWKFVVREGALREFERHYGRDGTWASLFHKARGYLGTELYRSVANAGEYVTVDRWVDEVAYRAFREEHAAEYEALDRECEALTVTEERMG
jgi:heme-degrading monooxygenase HmoA